MFGHNYFGAEYFDDDYFAEGTGVAAVARVDVAGARGRHQEYAPGERRRRGLEWTRRRKIEELVEEAYNRLFGDLATSINEPGTIREAVGPFVQVASDMAIPPPAAIDFAAMSRDLVRAEMLLQAYETALRQKALDDDDEEVMEILSLL